MTDATSRRQTELLAIMAAKNGHWFDTEMDKLDRWAEDRRSALKAELDDLDQTIKDAKKSARLAPNLPEKLEIQRKLRRLKPSGMKLGEPTMLPAATLTDKRIATR